MAARAQIFIGVVTDISMHNASLLPPQGGSAFQSAACFFEAIPNGSGRSTKSSPAYSEALSHDIHDTDASKRYTRSFAVYPASI